ncbi:hypothetical protein APHACPA_1407 [Rickettsia amblyommatis str. Ac/Pa]|uniref:Uncharacterized protein n=1 Tax=Rickettsia amblyommatis str. Ac/Pa TaxID=1359164 RepID=A0A0F3N3W7_RICAM|nr:hypothetical protein APHACPA_1407 [Rickettsia amblyommatis str. Ac/Pa]
MSRIFYSLFIKAALALSPIKEYFIKLPIFFQIGLLSIFVVSSHHLPTSFSFA